MLGMETRRRRRRIAIEEQQSSAEVFSMVDIFSMISKSKFSMAEVFSIISSIKFSIWKSEKIERKKITTNIFRRWGNSSKVQEILTLYLAQISSYTLSDFEAFKCWHSTEKIFNQENNQEKMQTKWPGQYGFGNDWWINRSKMRLNQSEITILNHPKITITTQEQHYNYNTQYYHPCFWCSSIGDLVTDSLTQWLLILTLQSDPRDLWPLWHLIRVMRRHDLTKKSTYPPTYQP